MTAPAEHAPPRCVVDERSLDGGGVVTVTVHRAERLNALDSGTIHDVHAAFAALAARDEVRAVVLTGAGDRAFIGGADIDEMARFDGPSGKAFITRLGALCRAVHDHPVPVVARVNGYALGAGLEVAACCDLRVVARSARLGMPEVRVGLPSVIDAARLPRLVGWGRARDLVLTGRWIDGDTALAWGLADYLAPDESLDTVLDEVLRGIVAGAPRAIRRQKALVNRWEQLGVDDGIAAGIDAFEQSFDDPEPGEYMQGFLRRKQEREQR